MSVDFRLGKGGPRWCWVVMDLYILADPPRGGGFRWVRVVRGTRIGSALGKVGGSGRGPLVLFRWMAGRARLA